MHGRVALVTDSTSCLSAELASQWGIGVVPVQIKIGDRIDTEDKVPSNVLVGALEQRVDVSTAAPAASTLLQAYQQAAERGAEEVVSVHISSRQSETCRAAYYAATQARLPVHVIDSRTTGMSLGYAVLACARVAAAGGGPRRVLDTLARRLDGSCELFYVDTLEYLRRGGRIGTAVAMLGGALSLKPLLTMEDGQVSALGRVLGAERALRRMVDTAVRRAGQGAVDVAVEHFGAAARARTVLNRLRPKLTGVQEIAITEVSSAIGVHLGPGAVGIAISPA